MSLATCDAVDAGRLVKVAGAVQQRQFDAGHLGEAGIALHLVELIGLVDAREGLGRLVEKLEAVAADLEIAQLLRRDDLKHHGGLV